MFLRKTHKYAKCTIERWLAYCNLRGEKSKPQMSLCWQLNNGKTIRMQIKTSKGHYNPYTDIQLWKQDVVYESNLVKLFYLRKIYMYQNVNKDRLKTKDACLYFGNLSKPVFWILKRERDQ